MKGLCKGELLVVMGRDANNNIYPITWAVVNVENKVYCKWFLDILMDDLGGGNGSGLTIISDEHKVLDWFLFALCFLLFNYLTLSFTFTNMF